MVTMAAIMQGIYSSDIFFLTTIVDYEVYLVCDKAFLTTIVDYEVYLVCDKAFR